MKNFSSGIIKIKDFKIQIKKMEKQVAGPALGARSRVKNNITHRNILKKYN